MFSKTIPWFMPKAENQGNSFAFLTVKAIYFGLLWWISVNNEPYSQAPNFTYPLSKSLAMMKCWISSVPS
jgi:hypothetical protein